MIAAIRAPVRRDDFQIQIVHQRRHRARKARHVRVRHRHEQRLRAVRHHDLLLVNLPRRERHGLIHEIILPVGADDLREVHAAPALVVVRHRAGLNRVIHVHGGIDQRRLDHRGRRRRAVVLGAIPLHEDRRRAGHLRAGLARAALEQVVERNVRPRELVIANRRTQRGNPSAGRDHVGLDASVLGRAAARKVRHRLLPEVVDEIVEAIVLRRAGGDDVLRHRRTANRLRARPGVARREFQNIRLVARQLRVRVPHQRIELRRADVVTPLRVIAPTVGADVRARRGGVARQLLEGERPIRRVTAFAIEEPLHHDVRARCHAESPERAVVVEFTRGTVACDNARDVRAVTVLVRRIEETAAVKQKRIHAPEQIRVHVLRRAQMQPAVRHRHGHTAAVVAERLRRCGVPAGIAAHDLRRRLVVQFHPRRALDPQHGVRGGERVQLPARNFPAPHAAKARHRLRGKFLHQPARRSQLRRRRVRGQQHRHGHIPARAEEFLARIFQPTVNLVRRAIRPRPPHEGQRLQFAQRDAARARHESVLRHVLHQRHAPLTQHFRPRRLHRAVELDHEQPRVRRRDRLTFLRRALRLGGGADVFVAQPDDAGFGGGQEPGGEKKTDERAEEDGAHGCIGRHARNVARGGELNK